MGIGNYGGNISIISFILAWTFISLQIKEFHTLAFYINDSIFGSIFFFLTGLHFFHVVVGIILIGIILCNFPLTVPRLPIYVLLTLIPNYFFLGFRADNCGQKDLFALGLRS